MEREHLIIIALILVALYMMNKDTKDIVKAISPFGRIRYTDVDPSLNPYGGSTAHIRTRREGFVADAEAGTFGQHIRLGDKYFGGSQHIKNHIRHNNRNNMFSGMMGTGCGGEMMQQMPKPIEKFRMDTDNSGQDNIGGEQHIRGLFV